MKPPKIFYLIIFTIAVSVVFFFAFPNYSDYRAAAQVNDWVVALNSCALSKKDKNISTHCQMSINKWFGSSSNTVLLHVDFNSLTLVGVKYKQTVVFWRAWSENGYQWKCNGYPSTDVSLKCRN